MYLLHGAQGLYDNWRRVDSSDHTPAVYAYLLDVDLTKIASGGPFSAISPTYEGGWAAFWPSPTLANYVLGRVYDSSIIGLTVDSVTGTTITQGVMGSFREESGAVVVSTKLNVICYYNRFARHGGTASGLKCQGVSDQASAWSLAKNIPWPNEPPDNLVDGGVALAVGTNSVVATFNYLRDDHKWKNGMYVYRARSASTGAVYIVRGGTYSAPAVAHDGRYAYAWRDGTVLVEIDTQTGVVREALLGIGSANSWPSPPIVTNERVIVIQTHDVATGDLVAYRRSDLQLAWRVVAGIQWHENNLSGWSRTDDFYAQADAETLYWGGNGALRALDHRTGGVRPFVYSDLNENENYYNIQLRDAGLMMQSTRATFECAECEVSLCANGLPVGTTDYSAERCCAGPTRRCPNVSCAVCEQSIGWCPNSQGRRCLSGIPSMKVVAMTTNVANN